MLLANRKEVTNMLLTEFDQKEFIKYEKDISFEEGVEKGVHLVNELYAWLAAQGRNEDVNKAICDPAYLDKLLSEYKMRNDR